MSATQLVVARRDELPSWPKLKQHFELVNRLTRAPEALTTRQDPADEFLRLACLTYGDDSIERHTRAAALLAADPAVGVASVHAAGGHRRGRRDAFVPRRRPGVCVSRRRAVRTSRS